MNECWDDSPINRPDFESIKKTIQRINPHKMSPVDLMMAMVSKTNMSIVSNGIGIKRRHILLHSNSC